MSATHRRFDRAARLLGDAGVARLASSTVVVIGVGGVGSYAAEGLVRSGVGRVILIDFDRVCVTNVNRQVHALKGTFGKTKVAVMAERLRLINPDAVIEARAEFYGAATSDRLLTPEPDVVVDAIDNVTAKMHLIATAVRQRLRLVTTLGAAARLDPTQIRHVREMLMGLKDRQTVLLSTHILSEVEKICDRVIMIHHGRIRACDTPQNLTRQLRAAATVSLEVKGEGKMSAKLEDLPGVRKAEEQSMPDGWRGITVRVEAQCDPREAILELATKENWKIREMHQELPTLEDVFVELAASDAPPPEE